MLRTPILISLLFNILTAQNPVRQIPVKGMVLDVEEIPDQTLLLCVRGTQIQLYKIETDHLTDIEVEGIPPGFLTPFSRMIYFNDHIYINGDKGVIKANPQKKFQFSPCGGPEAEIRWLQAHESGLWAVGPAGFFRKNDWNDDFGYAGPDLIDAQLQNDWHNGVTFCVGKKMAFFWTGEYMYHTNTDSLNWIKEKLYHQLGRVDQGDRYSVSFSNDSILMIRTHQRLVVATLRHEEHEERKFHGAWENLRHTGGFFGNTHFPYLETFNNQIITTEEPEVESILWLSSNAGKGWKIVTNLLSTLNTPKTIQLKFIRIGNNHLYAQINQQLIIRKL